MSASGTALTAGPEKRIYGLDVLRGLAVAGIVPMNVIAFAMPAAAYINPRAYGGDSGLDALLWAASFVLVEDKFRALFAIMFGAGVAIMLDRDMPRPLPSHYARMAALLAIGLTHAILLANNDVLRSYAVAGLVLPLVVTWPARRLLAGAALLIAGQFAISCYFAAPWLHAWWNGNVNPQAFQLIERMFGADPHVIADALERARESFAGRVVRRLSDIELQARTVLVSLPSTLAAMFVGIALWRNGLLAGCWEPGRAMRLALAGAGLAVPPLVVMAIFSMEAGFDAIVTAFNALVLSAPFDLVLGIAYAAGVMAAAKQEPEVQAVPRGWAAVGRMALTNYLGSSLIFVALFAAWGLSLFGQVARHEALAFGLIPIAAMYWWSAPWLRRYRQGPAEWLWRSLAAGKLLPLRRQPRVVADRH